MITGLPSALLQHRMEEPGTQEGLSPDQVERCISSMQSGTQMVKLRGGSKGLVRFYYLDEHKSCIRWRPSRKNEKAKISIDSVQEVCEGKQSEIFQRYADGSFDPNCCFSIYYGDHMESLDLVSSNGEEARTWITGLRYLMAGISDEDSLSKRQRTRDQWLKQTFDEADKNGDGSLSINEVLQLLHKLNVNLPRQKVKQMFKEADTDDNQGTLGFDEFCAFYKMMSTRRDLYLLMLTYSNHKDHLDTEDLKRFLEVEQKMTDVTEQYCLNIIDQFEPCLENKSKEVLGIDGFTNYTRSPEGDIFNPRHYQVNQDMTYPLSYYFITSSHNTYLIGDQLMSQSRVDMYSWVLQAGCRCVEVDCWDGPDGEPIVHHGYTLTSKILFKDVIETINKYAFIKNEYPVILSIENHCSVLQQKKMAQYLTDILGDKLDLSSVSSEDDSTTLPSPEKLKGKILVKGKKLPANISEDAEEGDVSDEDSADEIDEDCKLMNGDASTNRKRVENIAKKKLDSLIKESKIRDCEDPNNFTVSTLPPSGKLGQKAEGKKKFASLGASATDKAMSKVEEDMESGEDLSGSKRNSRLLMSSFSKRKKKGSKLKKTSSLEEGDDDLDSQGSQSRGINRQKKTMKLSRALSDLVKYTKSVGIHDVETEISSSWQVSSFSETKAHQILQQKPAHYLRFNQHQLSRIYPSSYRVDSSNYNPQPFWNAGCQMVALNYQSEGRMLQLNRAKFNANGNCGYVLKPQCMCQGVFNPNSEDPLPGQLKKQLILRIISGQQLPKPRDSMLGDRGEIIDPFVEVEIIGLPVDCNKEQTRVVDDNGFNPMWEETLVFTVHMPEIALVRFLVWDHDPIGRDFIGQRTLAFTSMMPGYRHVYLEGMEEASIFVHVAINDISGKVKQALGLKGLFLRNPKQASLDSHAAGQSHNRPSISGQLLRRTASAPTKSQKKAKKGFPELTMDTKDNGSEGAGEDTSQPRFDSEPESAAPAPGTLGEGPGRGPKDGRPFSIQRSVSSLYSLETIAEEPLVAKETPFPAPCPLLPPAPISDSEGGSPCSADSGSDTPLSSPSPGGPRTNGPGGLTAPGSHRTEGSPEGERLTNGGEQESRGALPTPPAGQGFLLHPSLSHCEEEPDGAAQRAERTDDPQGPRRPVGSVPLRIPPAAARTLAGPPAVVRRAKSEGQVTFDHLVLRRALSGQSPAAAVYSDATGSDQLWSKLEPGSHRDSMSSSSSMSSNDTVIDLSMPNLVRKSLPNLGCLTGSREKLGGLAVHKGPWPRSAASGGTELPPVTKSKSNPNLRAGVAPPPPPDELQPRPLARRPEDPLASLRRRPTWNRLYMEGLRAEGSSLGPRAQDMGTAAKSKSLGDLTSDDFAPGFESTYRSISRSFGPRPASAAGAGRSLGPRLQAGPRDELTEQLRRLTGFQLAGDITSPTSLGPAEDEEEDEPGPATAGQGPGFLRRSSSRSQSRVRYIATRARQAQERQRLQGLGGRGPLEERGNPEGACSVSREVCVDSLALLIPPSKLTPGLMEDSHSGPVLLKL
ncbi:1-phosphatidylinositol 4,5-bisphosphate phosphodiesterase eta-2 isoform X1 [Dromiciops gliroides]|uniref:1-phosphatidylinositol 4,5-bisphosphate phosphodiesterase eta-2 isoform X1 n=1 Tax=Dromiciops gliroides TaxID=33562 RepID=UPI001CC3CC36|nr:1-phosphatidylinositol 4,5-bisphosphate phosphodiesterase eta-2 isoform X1 [Dromiciops gliroides]